MGPASQPISWVQGLGQYPWVQRLGLLDSYAIFRSSFQYSDAPLLSLEQVSIGGRYSVRGYRENTMLRDRAALSSLEMRVPVISNTAWADYLELAQFVDFGQGWDVKLKTPSPKTLQVSAWECVGRSRSCGHFPSGLSSKCIGDID